MPSLFRFVTGWQGTARQITLRHSGLYRLAKEFYSNYVGNVQHCFNHRPSLQYIGSFVTICKRHSSDSAHTSDFGHTSPNAASESLGLNVPSSSHNNKFSHGDKNVLVGEIRTPGHSLASVDNYPTPSFQPNALPYIRAESILPLEENAFRTKSGVASISQANIAEMLLSYNTDPSAQRSYQDVLGYMQALSADQEAYNFLHHDRFLSPETLSLYHVGISNEEISNNKNESPRLQKCLTFPWLDQNKSLHGIKIRSLSSAQQDHQQLVSSFYGETSHDDQMRDDPFSFSTASSSVASLLNSAATTPTNTTTATLSQHAVPEWQDSLWIPTVSDAITLFGWHTVPPRASDIILTANELDAMLIHQETRRPCVALPQGVDALPQSTLKYLEQFSKIYVWFDDTHSNFEKARHFANKLGSKRCWIVRSKLGDAKGPTSVSEIRFRLNQRKAISAMANRSLKSTEDAHIILSSSASALPVKELKEYLNKAHEASHDEIERFGNKKENVMREILNPTQVAGLPCLSLPGLSRITKGFRMGELTIFTGPTGVGKTSVLSQLSLDYAKQGVGTLWGSFEIKNVRLMKKMIYQFAGKSFENDMSDFDSWADKFDKLPLYFLKYHGSTNLDSVLDAMSHAVLMDDVRHIIIDNLQFMMSSTALGNKFDKFDLMDGALHAFRTFATTKNVHISIVIHPRKEQDDMAISMSSIFGTAKATQEADNIIAIQKVGSSRHLEVLKNRFDGDLGIVPFHYDKSSCRLWEKALPSPKVKAEDHVQDSSITATSLGNSFRKDNTYTR